MMLFMVGLNTVALAALGDKPVYQPIIDVKPFGEMGTLNKASPQQLLEEQKQKEEIASKFRMCMITDLPDGSRKIAFVDETNKNVQFYSLAIGESNNGFTLVAADYDREYATLEKDGLVFTLGLGRGLIDQPPEIEEETLVESKTPSIEQVEIKPQRSAKIARSIPPAKGSFRDRLLQRTAEKEAATRKAEAAVKTAEAERAKAERRVQIERIKQGLAPTKPIELTPEEDQELQAAGVFDERTSEPSANNESIEVVE